MELVRVLIADDEALVRHALRVFVNASASATVVGEAVMGLEAVEQCALLRPDVILMDIQMPVMDGIEATAKITAQYPQTRVLAITTFSSERYVVAALRAGASSYLVKDTHPDQIIASIHDVHEGRAVLSPQVTRDLVAAVRESSGHEGRGGYVRAAELTERELETVRLLAHGMSNAEIAQALFLSEATVKSHLGRIMTKWSARDRVQVLIHAVKAGIVTL